MATSVSLAAAADIIMFGPDELELHHEMLKLEQDIQAASDRIAATAVLASGPAVTDKQLQELLQRMRGKLRDLELLSEEQDTDAQTDAVEACVELHQAEYQRLAGVIAAAKGQAKRQQQQEAEQMRRELFAGASLPALQREYKTVAEAVRGTSEVTASMQRAKAMLTQQIEQTSATMAVLDSSNNTLGQAKDEFVDQKKLHKKGSKLLNTIQKQERNDRRILWLGLLLFLTTCTYIGYKRAPGLVKAPVDLALGAAAGAATKMWRQAEPLVREQLKRLRAESPTDGPATFSPGSPPTRRPSEPDPLLSHLPEPKPQLQPEAEPELQLPQKQQPEEFRQEPPPQRPVHGARTPPAHDSSAGPGGPRTSGGFKLDREQRMQQRLQQLQQQRQQQRVSAPGEEERALELPKQPGSSREDHGLAAHELGMAYTSLDEMYGAGAGAVAAPAAPAPAAAGERGAESLGGSAAEESSLQQPGDGHGPSAEAPAVEQPQHQPEEDLSLDTFIFEDDGGIAPPTPPAPALSKEQEEQEEEQLEEQQPLQEPEEQQVEVQEQPEPPLELELGQLHFSHHEEIVLVQEPAPLDHAAAQGSSGSGGGADDDGADPHVRSLIAYARKNGVRRLPAWLRFLLSADSEFAAQVAEAEMLLEDMPPAPLGPEEIALIALWDPEAAEHYAVEEEEEPLQADGVGPGEAKDAGEQQEQVPAEEGAGSFSDPALRQVSEMAAAEDADKQLQQAEEEGYESYYDDPDLDQMSEPPVSPPPDAEAAAAAARQSAPQADSDSAGDGGEAAEEAEDGIAPPAEPAAGKDAGEVAAGASRDASAGAVGVAAGATASGVPAAASSDGSSSSQQLLGLREYARKNGVRRMPPWVRVMLADDPEFAAEVGRVEFERALRAQQPEADEGAKELQRDDEAEEPGQGPLEPLEKQRQEEEEQGLREADAADVAEVPSGGVGALEAPADEGEAQGEQVEEEKKGRVPTGSLEQEPARELEAAEKEEEEPKQDGADERPSEGPDAGGQAMAADGAVADLVRGAADSAHPSAAKAAEASATTPDAATQTDHPTPSAQLPTDSAAADAEEEAEEEAEVKEEEAEDPRLEGLRQMARESGVKGLSRELRRLLADDPEFAAQVVKADFEDASRERRERMRQEMMRAGSAAGAVPGSRQGAAERLQTGGRGGGAGWAERWAAYQGGA